MQERRRLAEEESLRRMEARRLQELLAANGRLQPMSLPNLSAPSVTSVASSKKKKVMMMKTAEDTVSLPSIRAHSARRSKVMPASLPPLFTTTKSAGGNEGPKQSSPLRTENPSQEQEDINPRSASGTRIPTRRRHPRARNSDAPQNADNKPRVETVKVKRDQDEEDDSISDDSIRDLITFESSDFNTAGGMNSSPVSSLTNESVTSYSGQFNNLSRKKKNKTKAWRLAPIPLKPYVPIPGEQSLR